MIPLLELQSQHASIPTEIDEAAARAIDSSRFALGPEVTAFGEGYAAYCDSAQRLAVNSGTSAPDLALLVASPSRFLSALKPSTVAMDSAQVEAAETFADDHPALGGFRRASLLATGCEDALGDNGGLDSKLLRCPRSGHRR